MSELPLHDHAATSAEQLAFFRSTFAGFTSLGPLLDWGRARGLRILANEAVWPWLPAAVIGGIGPAAGRMKEQARGD